LSRFASAYVGPGFLPGKMSSNNHGGAGVGCTGERNLERKEGKENLLSSAHFSP